MEQEKIQDCICHPAKSEKGRWPKLGQSEEERNGFESHMATNTV